MVSRGDRSLRPDCPSAIRDHPVYSCRAPATEPAGGDAAGTTGDDDRRAPSSVVVAGAIMALVLLLARGAAASPWPCWRGRCSRPSTRRTRAQADLKLAKTELSQQHLAEGPDLDRRRAHPRRRRAPRRPRARRRRLVRRTGRRGRRRRRAPPRRRARRDDLGRRARRRGLPDGVGPRLPAGQRPEHRPEGPADSRRPGRARSAPTSTAAMADVDEVQGSTPIVGGAVSRAKDSALGYLQPVQDSYAKAGPLVASLPSIVGRATAHAPTCSRCSTRPSSGTPAAVRCRSPRCTSTTAGSRSGRA